MSQKKTKTQKNETSKKCDEINCLINITKKS